MAYTYQYPRPSVTADVVAFTMRADDLAVLLIRRKDEPFKGCWALPGGFVNENESLDRAAARELQEETGLTVNPSRLEQLGAFGDPGRDPRGHTVTVAFVTFRATETAIDPGDDAVEAEWHPLRALELGDVSTARSVPPPPPPGSKSTKKAVTKSAPVRLAFDHAIILNRAYRRLCRHLNDPSSDYAFDVMPPRFTLAELRRIYEVVIGKELTPRVIRQHLVDRGVIVPATSKPTTKANQLYRWNRG